MTIKDDSEDAVAKHYADQQSLPPRALESYPGYPDLASAMIAHRRWLREQPIPAALRATDSVGTC